MSSMSTEELERAFKAHSRELRVFPYRQLQSTETAADLTQETWRRMLRQRLRKPVENLRTFTSRIGRKLAIDHVHSRASRERHDEGLAYLYEATGHSAELIDTIAASQELEALNAALQRMGEPEQSIFLQCRLQGIAHKEVARELGMSLSSVSWDDYRTMVDLSSPLNEQSTLRGRSVVSYNDANSSIDNVKKEHQLFYGIVEMDLTPNTLATLVTRGMAGQRYLPVKTAASTRCHALLTLPVSGTG